MPLSRQSKPTWKQLLYTAVESRLLGQGSQLNTQFQQPSIALRLLLEAQQRPITTEPLMELSDQQPALGLLTPYVLLVAFS